MKICCSSWSQRHIGSALWMDVIEMQDIRAVTLPCPYCRSAFGGQRWPARCSNPSGPAHAVYSMRAACPGPPYTPSWPLLPRISYMLILPPWRPLWSQTRHLELLTSWCSKTTSWSTYWHTWPLTKLQKPLLNSCIRVTSPSLEPWPGSWVTEVLTSWAVWSTKCARSLAWRNCRPCPTTHRLMGW